MEEQKLSGCDEILHRILEVDRVQGYVIINEIGLKSHEKVENTTALQYSQLYREITNMAQSLVRDLDPANELMYFRVQTKKNEVLAALADDEVTLVIQKTVTDLFE